MPPLTSPHCFRLCTVTHHAPFLAPHTFPATLYHLHYIFIWWSYRSQISIIKIRRIDKLQKDVTQVYRICETHNILQSAILLQLPMQCVRKLCNCKMNSRLVIIKLALPVRCLPVQPCHTASHSHIVCPVFSISCLHSPFFSLFHFLLFHIYPLPFIWLIIA